MYENWIYTNKSRSTEPEDVVYVYQLRLYTSRKLRAAHLSDMPQRAAAPRNSLEAHRRTESPFLGALNFEG